MLQRLKKCIVPILSCTSCARHCRISELCALRSTLTSSMYPILLTVPQGTSAQPDRDPSLIIQRVPSPMTCCCWQSYMLPNVRLQTKTSFPPEKPCLRRTVRLGLSSSRPCLQCPTQHLEHIVNTQQIFNKMLHEQHLFCYVNGWLDLFDIFDIKVSLPLTNTPSYSPNAKHESSWLKIMCAKYML